MNDEFWNMMNEHAEKLNKAGNTLDLDYKPRGKPPKKSTSKKDIKKLIKEVKDTKIKKVGKSKLNDITNILNLVGDIHKKPKTKKIETESIKDTINEVDKLLKTPKKGLKKLIKADKEHLKYHPSQQDYKEMRMDQKVYKHKVKDISPHIAGYVASYKELMNKDNKGGARTRAIDKLRNAFMSVARPSDIDDANALIREYKETLPKPEPKVKAKKTTSKKVVVSESYTDDPKYKTYTLYVKKNKPSIKDVDDIHNIVCDLIDKKQRMSKKLLDAVIEDLGITGSGLNKKKRKIKGGMINNDSGEETSPSESGNEEEDEDDDLPGLYPHPDTDDGLTDEDVPTYDEAHDYTVRTNGDFNMRDYNMIIRNENANTYIHKDDGDYSKSPQAVIDLFKKIDQVDPKGLIDAFESIDDIPESYNKDKPYLNKLLQIKRLLISEPKDSELLNDIIRNYIRLRRRQKTSVKSNPTKDLKKDRDKDDDEDRPSKRNAHTPYMNEPIPFASHGVY